MVEKRVDEHWKEEVERERQRLRTQEPPRAVPEPPPAPPPREQPPPPAAAEVPEEMELPEPTLAVFLSSLSMQAMMALERQGDLEQARYLIDTLGVLQEKTRGNLTAEESQLLENALYELRLRYAQKLEASIPPPPGARP